MIKSLLLFILINLYSYVSFGQKSIVDSLTQALSTVEHDTTAVNILTQLSLNESLGDFKKSQDYAYSALKIANKINYKRGIANAHYALGMVYDLNYKLDSALFHYNITLKLYKPLHYLKGEGNVYSGLGYVYMALGNYEKAVENALIGLKKREELGNKIEIAGSYMLLANIFNDEGGFHQENNQENKQKALEYNQQALEIYRAENDEKQAGKVIGNIALLYETMGKMDSSLIMSRESLAIANKFNDQVGIAISKNNIGSKLRKIGRYDEALSYLNEANELYIKMNYKQGQINPLYNMSKVYEGKGDYKKYLEYSYKSYLISKELNNKILLLNSTKYLAEAYATAGEFEKAYKTFILHKAYSDSIYDNKRSKEMQDLEMSYGLEKKEQQISNLQKETELADLRKNILIGSIIAIIIVAFFLYNQQRLRSKKNRHLLEKEKELDRIKSRFFSNISHEFRTPLTLLIGPIEEIKQTTKDYKTRLYLDMMRKNAGKLLNQVNQLLDLSKLDAGQLNLKISRFDIISFVRGTVMSFESLADSRKINLKFDTNAESLFIFADKDCIEKIVVNLVSNALKFTNALDFVSVAVKHQKEKVEIVVSDTGQGFDPDVRKHLFERYYHTESDMQASTGIGLALVKELVEKHNGTIEVSGSKGQGSSFNVKLPIGSEQMSNVADSDETVITRPEVSIIETELCEEEINTHERILIIEDNADVRLFIKEVLKTNYKIIEAENGKDGILLAEEHLPDLIITDVMMPEMNGYEVTQRLKQNEKTSHIPIIILTAKADQESKIKGLETEADDYLTKPFDGSELMARIANLINTRNKLREQFSKMITLKPKEIAITSVDANFLEKVMLSIEDNIDNEALSVESLGRMVGMSRSQIHRKLQALTGQPPNKFIRNMRLGRAMELLKNNAGSVAEIAYMTGFSSPNYFSKCFHDQFGYAPGEVKKLA